MRLLLTEPDSDGRSRSRALYVSSIPSLEQWSTVLGADDWPVRATDGFALLLAGDLNGVGTQLVADLATWCIEHRIFSVSVWGAGCERVHDIFDEVDVADGVMRATGPAGDNPDSIVVTTWHDEETFGQTLDFFWECSVAAEGKVTGPAHVVLIVGESASLDQLRKWVAAGVAETLDD